MLCENFGYYDCFIHALSKPCSSLLFNGFSGQPSSGILKVKLPIKSGALF